MDDLMKRFIDLYIPIEQCNLKCHYCYVSQNQENYELHKLRKLNINLNKIKEGFSKELLGGVCLLNLCAGGETLLLPEMIDVIRVLLEAGHYLMIVTNGIITDRFISMSCFPRELRERLFIKFSFHFLELKKKNLIDIFFNNVKLMMENEISITLELGASDEHIPYINEIKNLCFEYVGALPHITILRDEEKAGFELLSKYSMEQLEEIWKDFQSSFFEVRKQIWGVRRREFCYAGVWSFSANIETGELKKCCYEEVIGNLYDGLKLENKLEPVGCHCKAAYCYAGQSFLTLGDIPELSFPTLADIRDRKDANWLKPKMRRFMSQTLSQNNKKYNKIKKFFIEKNLNKKKYANLLSPQKFQEKIILDLMNEYLEISYIMIQAQNYLRSYYNEDIPQELKWIYNYRQVDHTISSGVNIIISTNGEKNIQSEGNEIWFIGAIVDNIWYDATEICKDGWITRKNCKIWRDYNLSEKIEHRLCGVIPNGKKIILVFDKNRWRGIANVEIGNKAFNLDTYNESDQGCMFYLLKDI